MTALLTALQGRKAPGQQAGSLLSLLVIHFANPPMVPNDKSKSGDRPEQRRLNSWKEIAEYLERKVGRPISTRTFLRWRTRQGLPVYKLVSSVYAYTDELDKWLTRGIGELSAGGDPSISNANAPIAEIATELEPDPPPRGTPSPAGIPERGSQVRTEESPVRIPPARDESKERMQSRHGPESERWHKQKILPILGIAAIIIAFAGAAMVLSRNSSPYSVRFTQPLGRLLVRSTSEGSAPRHYPLNSPATLLAITPDGRRVFAGSNTTPVISILQPLASRMDTVFVATGLNSMRISPDGKYLYAASRVDGVLVLDVDTGLVVRHYSTAGEVFDLAVSPDGRKLFLAMSHRGLWRILADGKDLKQISPQTCPESLTVGPSNRLYVSFQCGGAIGRPGHDTVEAYDTESERRLARATGPPLVASRLAASPYGDTLGMDSGDACAVPQYDRQGCPPGESEMLHLLDLTDYRFTDSIQIEFPMQVARYIDRSRLLLVGRRLSVIDSYRRAEVEGLTIEQRMQSSVVTAAVLDSASNRMYVALDRTPEILGFRTDPSVCSPDEPGLVAFYPGDGNATDVIGTGSLKPTGFLKFVPGHVGQAFEFDGKSAYLRGPTTAHDQLGRGDSSIVFDVKFAKTAGEMALFHHRSHDFLSGAYIFKTDDNRVALNLQGPRTKVHLQSGKLLVPGRWYSIAVTKSDRQATLYINGQPQDSGGWQRAMIEINATGPTTFGASVDLDRYLDGKLDEIRQYNRALTPDEVRNLYEMHEKGPCAIAVPDTMAANRGSFIRSRR